VRQRSAEAAGGGLPPDARGDLDARGTRCGCLVGLVLEHGDDGGELLGRRIPGDDTDVRDSAGIRGRTDLRDAAGRRPGL
jgi:hypothetical protein